MWIGIYRDYRLLVFKAKRSIPEIQIWKDKFQEKVDEISGNYYLQLTCETWNPGRCPSRNETKTTSIISKKSSPIFDLELFWKKGGKLEFQIHQKKNQPLKHLSK